MSDSAVIESPTPEASAATPATEPAATTPGTTPASSGDVSGGAPAEETFSSVDVKTLPPQLRAAYDNMLRDYKDKTTKLSEERKQYEAAKEKASLYDQISQDEAFVKYWNGLTKGEKAEVKAEMKEQLDISDEEFVAALTSGDKSKFVGLVQKLMDHQSRSLNERLESANQQIRYQQADQVIDAFSGAKDKEGNLLYPDFEKFEGVRFGEQSDLISVCLQLDRSPAESQPQQMKKLERAYAMAGKIYNEIFESGRKAGLGIVEKKVQRSTEAPTNPGSAQVFSGDYSKLTARDHIALARQGIRIPRD